MEYAIGRRATIEVVEANSLPLCRGCFFILICTKNRDANICSAKNRTDGTEIIYKEIEED